MKDAGRMRGLCGWFSTHPLSDGEDKLQRMLAGARTPTGDSTQMGSEHAGLAVFGSVARPRVVAVDGTLLATTGHPYFYQGNQRCSDPSEIARMVRARGKDALSSLRGDFAIAAWDSGRKRGLIAVDRIGIHQLVYRRTDVSLAFASTLDLLCGFPGIPRTLSKQAIFDYLFYHVSPGPDTIFKDLYRVPPGQCVEFGFGAPTEPSSFWSMRFNEDGGRALADLKEEFIALLEGSVRDIHQDGASVGAFLSGGTDSSTVSGILARVSGATTRTFSIGFDVQGYDEMEYARLAAKHFGCQHNEYYVTPKDVVEAVPTIAATYDQPFGNASAIPTFYCAKFAKENGVTHLLAGDGGDELFGGNERYAKQYLLGLYQCLPEFVRSSLIEPYMRNATRGQSFAPLRKLRSYVEQAKPPMPERYESYNLLNHLGNANVFEAEFLSSVDSLHPRKLMIDSHTPYASASLVNQMLAIDLRFILADGDLPKVTRMCELAGVDVSFPLLDDRLIEFSQKLPSDMKLRGTKLRWFFKQALQDFLPPAVITKQKHGFGLPVGAWLTTHKPLYDLAADSAALLRHRGIVQPRFIDDLFSNKLREHPAYFGNMVWVLMMLGLWLDSRKI